MAEATNNEVKQPEFHIQRVYIKDVSFEAPNTPAIFQKEWQPEVKLDMDTKTVALAEGIYEVCLTLTVTCSLGDEVAFLCEVKQAGIFTAANLDAPQLAHCLGSYCPNILFPYAREAVSDATVRAGFPPVVLQPVNFDAMAQQTAEADAAAAAEAPATLQ